MLNMVINFVRGLTKSPIGSFVSQLLQIGALSTVWMFIGNMVKTMQRNVVSLTATAVSSAATSLATMPAAA